MPDQAMSQCDKCNGLVVNLYDDVHCMNCGKRFVPVSTEPLDNYKLRWESVLCEKCHTRKAVRGKLLCRECPGRNCIGDDGYTEFMAPL